MLIREFIPQDLERVYEIEKMSFSDPYDINILKQLYDIGCGFLVAENNKYIVGYILFWAINENEGHIISLAIDKYNKRLKIGTKLLKTAILVFKSFNISKINLEVKIQNKEAIEFYKSFGFRCIEKIEDYYEDGSDALKLFLDINELKHS
ncbi:MAG: ribosomal protein S18-alanine N-acetyltransferase [Methanobrevibacter sp.]|jgi:ribosomal-protein-alanine N-acetyltransferase|nr:ribosomal protein S18-alanine N-acetyltransferase [Methanobrevibacter sp.]